MSNWDKFEKWSIEKRAVAIVFIISSIGLVISLISIPSSLVAIRDILAPSQIKNLIDNSDKSSTTSITSIKSSDNTANTSILATPPLASPIVKNPDDGVFLIRSSINSEAGEQISDSLIRRLEKLGVVITHDTKNASIDVEIESLKIEGPRYGTNDRLVWITTATINIIFRLRTNNLPIGSKTFIGISTTDEPATSRSTALVQAVDHAAQYISSNRQSFIR